MQVERATTATATRAVRTTARAALYATLVSALPAVAVGLAVALGLQGSAAGLATATIVLIFALAALIVTQPRQRRLVELVGRPELPRPAAASRRRARELAHGAVTLVVSPLVVVLLFAWITAVPLLLAAPLIVTGGGFVIWPLTIDDPSAAWLGATVGVAGLITGACTLVAFAESHAALTAILLGPGGGDVRAQLTELTRSRVRLVDAFDLERRRIERDLHDGAQQQLTSLAMTLDLVRLDLDAGNASDARQALDRAHAQALDAIGDLRELIRNIHPPALAEHGLATALRQLAEQAPQPVELHIAVERRLAASVESTAYFVVSEALANVTKHSGATRATVQADIAHRTLELTVEDDGRGGAAPEAGSGLTGLADRIAAAGGTLTLCSPPGGPTVLTARIPI